MPKRFHLNQPERAKEVTTALASCQDVSDQQRLLAMRLVASGQLTAAQIAEQVGISRRQFFNWVKALKAQGVTGLLAREHRGGRTPQVQGKVREEFQAGLKSGRWKRAKEIQAWLRSELQVKLGLKGVYYWLGKLGGALKVPRKTHAKKDAAQAVEFQRTLCEKLKTLNVAGGKPVRIWVADEHRYGLLGWCANAGPCGASGRRHRIRPSMSGAISTRPWRWTEKTPRIFSVCRESAWS